MAGTSMGLDDKNHNAIPTTATTTNDKAFMNRRRGMLCRQPLASRRTIHPSKKRDMRQRRSAPTSPPMNSPCSEADTASLLAFGFTFFPVACRHHRIAPLNLDGLDDWLF